MNLMQDYSMADSIPKGSNTQHSNKIDLRVSYITHLTPMSFTTEMNVLTREVRADQFFGEVHPVSDNMSTPLPLPQLVPAKVKVGFNSVAALESMISIGKESVTEYAERNDWPMPSVYAVGGQQLIDVPPGEGFCNLHSIVQSVPLSFFNNGLTAMRIVRDLSPVNTAVLERTPNGYATKFIYQQLLKTAKEEAREMRAIVMRFQEGLEKLMLGPLQQAFPSTRGAVRVRGKLPVLSSKPGVKGIIVDEDLSIEEELYFPTTHEPEIHQGELMLSLMAPRRLVGQTANVLLSMEGREILLGIVAVEAKEGDEAGIELEVDLRSVGVDTKDGMVSLDAFQIVVEQSKCVGTKG